jgi:hypothetical protein
MKTYVTFIAGCITFAAMVVLLPHAEAYPTFSQFKVYHPPLDPRCRETDLEGCEEPVGNCQTCHGHFRATDENNSRPYLRDEYISRADGRHWSELYQEVEADTVEEEIGLHDIHRHVIVDKLGRSRCNVCHQESGRYPVILNSSAGGEGLEPIACVGCHGRNEDTGFHAGGQSQPGAGLRQHHTNSGINVCKTCHWDADPSNYTPVGENVLPSYYTVPNEIFVNKPTDPCNQRGDENYAGGPTGLDNDGDGRYDKSDLDCQPTGPGNNNARR